MARGSMNPGKVPVVRESYAEQVYAYIKGLILSGELRQGEKIPEEKVAELIGVSRTPIREALRRLQAYGLVNLKPYSFGEVVRISADEAKDIAELRLHLEKLAFRLLSARGDSGALAELQEIANRAQDDLQRGDRAAYFEADAAFHRVVADKSGNSQLPLLYSQFDGKVQLLRIAQDVPVERLEIYMRQHFDFLEMLQEGRTGAIDELLRVHIVHDLVNDPLA